MTLSLATIDASPTSALQTAFQGSLQNKVAFAEEALCDDPENEDLHGVEPAVARISADAKNGRFHEPGLEDLKLIDASPRELLGVMLARVESAVHFIPQDTTKALAAALGYGPLLTAEKTICRNENLVDLQAATLSPSLTPDQVEAARRIGIGGATGRGCAGCAAGKYYAWADRNLRPCTKTESVIWLDSRIEEPVVLQISAQSSIMAFRQFLADHFRKGKKKAWLCSAVVRLTWESQVLKNNKVWVLVPEIVCALPGDKIKELLASRDLHSSMLERAARQMEEQGVVPESPPVNDAPPPSDSDYESTQDALGGML